MSTVERKSVNISMDLTTMLTGRIPKEKIEEKNTSAIIYQKMNN